MRLTLFERLKPEVKAKLDKNKEKYAASIEMIYKSLKEKVFYRDLTIDDVHNIYTFTDTTMSRVSSWDLAFGENLFEQLDIKKLLDEK